MHHTARKGAIPDHGDGEIVAPLQTVGAREAERSGNGGRTVPRAEGIVFALLASGEARETARDAQRVETVAPSGQQFVNVALMPDVEDDPVVRRVENAVQGEGQFDDAEIRGEVTPRLSDRVDQIFPDLSRKGPDLFFGDPTQVGGRIDFCKDWSFFHI